MHAFNPSELIGLAERLGKDGTEASDRTAVSRAYYGIFLIARELMRVKAPDGRAHRLTQEKLKVCGQSGLSIDLAYLRGLRNESDYVMDRLVAPETATNALNTAWRMHRALNRLRAKSKRRPARKK